MKDILENISQFIEYQFPQHYRENYNVDLTESDRAVLVDFVEAYYEFIEETRGESFLRSRSMFEFGDIDDTLQEFIIYFKNKYLDGLPFTYASDIRFVIKNIIDLYRVKGSEKGLKLLIRLLFNEDVEVYYPEVDILRPSHSIWRQPKYIELTKSSRSIDFIGTTITGTQSGVTAFVEGLVTKRVNQKLIDVMYISNVRGGEFVTGELVTNNNNIRSAPTIIGSLTDIDDIVGSSQGYSVGDRLTVVANSGEQAVAKITAIQNANDKVDFTLLDGGYGYTVADSKVFITEAVLFCDNANLQFQELENVSQKLALIKTANTISANTEVGDIVEGLDATSNTVSEGFIVEITSNNSITVEQTSNTNFISSREIELVDPNVFLDSESVKEESIVNLTLPDATIFTVGESIVQKDDSGLVPTNIATGVVTAVNPSVLELDQVFGDFQIGSTIIGSNSNANSSITDVIVVNDGAAGDIISSTNTSITVVTTNEKDFTANNLIRGETTKTLNTANNITLQGVLSINIDGDTYTVSDIDDVTASGTALGQDEKYVGVSGNTFPFFTTANTQNLIYTSETDLQVEITDIGRGTGADFKVGSLVDDTQETITISTDFIGDTNVAGIKYTDINILTANNSGVGKISANVDIFDGGTGYSNTSTIEFLGGGHANTNPLIYAQGEVVTDSNGAITDVIITEQGYGYQLEPEVVISDGTGANVGLTFITGYGFPKDPYAGYDDIINDALSDKTITIGEIETLAQINPGGGYNTDVFLRVENEDVVDFDKEDVNIVVEASVGGLFANGEVVEANNGAKGRIRNITGDTLDVKRLTFSQSFESANTIQGQTSSVSSDIISISTLGRPFMGANAKVSARVFLLNGLVADVEILQSGFGYLNNDPVEMFDENGILVASGLSNVTRQGKALGFWETTSSHLNDQVLRDNFFYQEFSYQIIAGISLDTYEAAVRDILHTAGTKYFGKVKKYSTADSAYTTTSVIDTSV